MRTKVCRETGCPEYAEPKASRCVAHQLQQWKLVPADLRDRFAARMVEDVTTNETGCWLYAGPRNATSGYAVGELAGQRVFVHRWMYWHLVGGLKPGHELHHICGGADEQDTRHCIRPAHLIQILPGDHREETRIRAKMLAAAKPDSRFHQTEHGERGWSAVFARKHDLPRHEPKFNTELYPNRELVLDWNLVMPERFQRSRE